MEEQSGRVRRRSACRGVRGATTVEGRGEEELLSAVGGLLERMLRDNRARTEDVAALIFTVPEELMGVNPAAAARRCGFSQVPLLVVREDGGDQRVERCLRALLLLNTELAQDEIRHSYLGRAAQLRPDLVAAGAQP